MRTQPTPRHSLRADPATRVAPAPQGETGHAIGDNGSTAMRRDLPLPLGGRTIGAQRPQRIHAMSHRIDAEHEQDVAQGAVVNLRPGRAAPAPHASPAARPDPARPARGESPVTSTPIWDKNNFGFWLAMCILISLVFSIVYHALG